MVITLDMDPWLVTLVVCMVSLVMLSHLGFQLYKLRLLNG